MLTPEVREGLAKAIHEAYRRDQRGRKGADDPAMAEWDELGEDLKESSRYQADGVLGLLRDAGWEVQAARGRAAAVAFDPEEVEAMAERVHERWMEGRRRAGWRLGLERDVAGRVSPYLVPWADLEDSVREYDRETVRALPEALAEVGLELRRAR